MYDFAVLLLLIQTGTGVMFKKVALLRTERKSETLSVLGKINQLIVVQPSSGIPSLQNEAVFNMNKILSKNSSHRIFMILYKM